MAIWQSHETDASFKGHVQMLLRLGEMDFPATEVMDGLSVSILLCVRIKYLAQQEATGKPNS
jgi:hypothetical protein